jgi:hypothetical protein
MLAGGLANSRVNSLRVIHGHDAGVQRLEAAGNVITVGSKQRSHETKAAASIGGPGAIISRLTTNEVNNAAAEAAKSSSLRKSMHCLI